MKILFCHIFDDPKYYMHNAIHSWLNRLNTNIKLDVEITSFSTALSIPGKRAPFKLLDLKWKSKDPELLNIYEAIIKDIHKFDALINFGGVNLHPDFVTQLPVTTVWNFYDDPESSSEYSKFMANSHDLCAIGNIASLEDYKIWGNKNIFWSPCGFRFDDFEPSLKYEDIIQKERTNDIALLCERIGPYRRTKVDKYSLKFPQGAYYGMGWPKGFYPEDQRI